MKKSVTIIIGVGLLIVGMALGFGVSTLIGKNSSKHGGPGGMNKIAASGGAISGSEDGRPERPDGDSSDGSGRKGTPPDMKDGGNGGPQGKHGDSNNSGADGTSTQDSESSDGTTS